MKILVCEPGKHPYVKDIEHTLENLQAEVDGYTTSLVVDGGSSEEVLEKTLTLSGPTTVAFTNYRPPVAPTDVDFDSKPYVMILALGGLLAVAALSMRRRRREVDA